MNLNLQGVVDSRQEASWLRGTRRFSSRLRGKSIPQLHFPAKASVKGFFTIVALK